MDKHFTLKKADAVFKKLAADPRLPHAYGNKCAERREAMIGIMLDELGVPIENIGRIGVMDSYLLGNMKLPKLDVILDEASYLDPAWVDQQPERHAKRLKGHVLTQQEYDELHTHHINYRYHTAPVVLCYNPSMEQMTTMVIDPHLNAERMITPNEFASTLGRRTHTTLHGGIAPLTDNDPNIPALRMPGGFTQWTKSKTLTVCNKEKWLNALAQSCDELRDKALLGADFVKKWSQLNDWSQGSAL